MSMTAQTSTTEPCTFCGSALTGPDYATPIGICSPCACGDCHGFRWRDDRGFLCTGQPFFEKTACASCGGEGTRTAQRARGGSA